MYRPKDFMLDDQNEIDHLISTHPFATLISNSAHDTIITHLPINRFKDGHLYGHLARNNPHADVANNSDACAIFHGPHAYISPRYYQSDFNVPTWNYATVHCHGTLSFIDDAKESWNCFQEMVRIYEGDDGWQLPQEARFQSLTQGIRFFKIDQPRYEAKVKFNQNKSKDDIRSVIQHLSGHNNLASEYMRRINSL